MLKKLFVLFNLMMPMNLLAHDFKIYHHHNEYILCISFLILAFIIKINKKKENEKKNL